METFGKYALLEQLNAGDTSDVFFGKPLEGKNSESLIIKRLKPATAENKDYLQAFLEGAKQSAQLDHPGISSTSDFGAFNNTQFLARKYAPGKDLKTLARRHSVQRRLVPQPATLYIVQKILDALECAHEKKIVHGCLTLSDVLIGFQGELTIINFGLGPYYARRIAAQGSLPKDKLSYLAPEHVSGEKVNTRTDIFSLGLVFYELLTGNAIFPDGLDATAIEGIRKKAITPPSGVRPSISTTLDAIVMKCLEIDSVHRYSTVGEMKNDLEAAIKEGLDVGSSDDISALMNRTFPNEALLERERIALSIPEDLVAQTKTKSPEPQEPQPLPKEAKVEVKHQPQPAVAPIDVGPSVESEKGKSKGLYVVLGLVAVAIIAIGAFFATKKPEEKDNAEHVASLTTEGSSTSTDPAAPPEPAKPPLETKAAVPPATKDVPAAAAKKDELPDATEDTTDQPTTPDKPATSVTAAKQEPSHSTSHRRSTPRSRPRPRPRPSYRPPPPPPPRPTKVEPPPPPPVEKTDPKPRPATTPPVKPDWTKPEPVKPAKPESGFLKILSATPIDVEVDGWKAAVTSGVLNMKLAPGSHNVKVIFKESGKSFTKTMDISPGKTKVLRLVRSQ